MASATAARGDRAGARRRRRWWRRAPNCSHGVPASPGSTRVGGGRSELPSTAAHADLDRVVLEAYGFDPAGDVLDQLLGLNRSLAEASRAGVTS